MAPRKTAASPEPAKKQVNKYDEELAAFAAEYGAKESGTGTGNFISTRGGRFSLNGADLGTVLNLVVVDHAFENHYYDTPYDQDNPTPPACFALASTIEELAPHENSAAPQFDQCKGCPLNEFGSAERGRGKACGNIRRLAVLTEEDLGDVANASVAFLKIPVTSVSAWAGYVQQLANVMKVPPFAVVTEVSIVQGNPYKLVFKLVEQTTDKAVVRSLITKRGEIQTDLLAPYAPASEEPEPPKKSARKPTPAARKPTPAAARKPVMPARKPAPAAPAKKAGRKF